MLYERDEPTGDLGPIHIVESRVGWMNHGLMGPSCRGAGSHRAQTSMGAGGRAYVRACASAGAVH